jgi:hypothetical protein
MSGALVEMMRIVANDKDFTDFSYTLEEDTYVWIEYKTFSLDLEEEAPEEENTTDNDVSEE